MPCIHLCRSHVLLNAILCLRSVLYPALAKLYSQFGALATLSSSCRSITFYVGHAASNSLDLQRHVNACCASCVVFFVLPACNTAHMCCTPLAPLLCLTRVSRFTAMYLACLLQFVSRLNHLGGCLDMHACFLLQRGLKTLPLRVRQQSANALALAQFLEKQPQVSFISSAA